MSSKFFSKKAFGIAAASAAVLVATPGIALAGTTAPQKPGDQTEQVLAYPGGDIKITCIYDKDHKKWDHKVDGGKDDVAPTAKPSHDATGEGGDANGSGDEGKNGVYSKKDSSKDQVNRRDSSEEPNGSDHRKKGSKKNISKVIQETEQSNASKQGQAAVIVLNIGCGNQLVKDNAVTVAQEQQATQQNQSSQAGASAAGKDNSLSSSASSSQGAGDATGTLRAADPVGAVDGGDGGSTAPNTGLAAGGAGALAAAGIGTVLMRRRRADETIA